MDEIQNKAHPSTERRKRKLTPFERIIQNYLPLIIIGVSLVLILIFVFGAVINGFQYRTLVKQLKHDAAVAAKEEQARQAAECETLLTRAAEMANQYDYSGAIRVLQGFTGKASDFPAIEAKIGEYKEKMDTLTQWTDFQSIPNLSFEMLIADPERAFSDAKYASSYKKNFITTDEFQVILEQLYENNYILVSLDDLYEYKKTDAGVSYFIERDLYLPNNKKPLILTQTQVNYNLYMVDSDGDMIPDAGGAGFASKLMVDENGNLTSQIVNSDGSIDEGAYDMIPILESFIATHPDFSYRGARAVIALTGYNGLFGYRTHAEAASVLGDETYQEEIQKAKVVAQKLQETGYVLACYTYENKDYSKFTATKIEADMSGWTAEVVPILGQLDTFVFAKNGDIASKSDDYTSESYHYLRENGFRFFLGSCKDGSPWLDVSDQYVRQGRISVTASNIANKSGWFTGIFDPDTVLLEDR